MTWCFSECVCSDTAALVFDWLSTLTETLRSQSCVAEITPTGQTKGTQTRSIANHPSPQPELALPAQLIQSDDLTSGLPTSPTNTHKHSAPALHCVAVHARTLWPLQTHRATSLSVPFQEGYKRYSAYCESISMLLRTRYGHGWIFCTISVTQLRHVWSYQGNIASVQQS